MHICSIWDIKWSFKRFRIAAQNLIRAESLEEKKIEVVKSDINSRDAHSKIIKISLLMPKIGNGLKDINDLGINEYAWITNRTLKSKKSIKLGWFMIRKFLVLGN